MRRVFSERRVPVRETEESVKMEKHMKTFLVIAGLMLAFITGIIFSLLAVNRAAKKEAASGKYVMNPDYEHLVSGTIFQLSAEGQSLMEQAYNTAMKQVLLMQHLCEDPQEKDWEKKTGENGGPQMYCRGKRVALISDVDDTLVDGAHYTCSIIGENGDWNNVAFARFVMSEGCTALPGAVEFINAAKDAGIEIFYVTNRQDQGYKVGQEDSVSSYEETAGPEKKGAYIAADGTEIGTSIYQVFGKSMYDISMESMERLGFPVDDRHLILNDGKLYGSSKEPARNAIRNGQAAFPNGQREGENSIGSALSVDLEPHFVALYLGDQMTDFTDDFSREGMDAAGRAALVEKYADKLGTEWILLPNAMYGQAVDSGIRFGPRKLFQKFTGWVNKIFD